VLKRQGIIGYLCNMIERELDQLLDELRIGYRKSPMEEWVSYEITARPDIDLRLDLDLCGDTLNVNFNGCFAMLEEAAFTPMFGKNPKAFDEWRTHCLGYVRDILTNDLRIETRWLLGHLLGGYLYRWSGSKWESCGGGGSTFMFLGKRTVCEYRSWRA